MHFLAYVRASLTTDQQSNLQGRLTRYLKTISYREREIVRLRNGLNDGYWYTGVEVGHIFKLSASRVHQLERRALRKLLSPARLSLLADFLTGFGVDKPSDAVVHAIGSCEDELFKYVAKNPRAVHNLTPREFEKLIARCLESFGFHVQLTAETRDGGYDILAFASDQLGITTKYIVECKRFSADNRVGVELVRNLYGVKNSMNVDHALLATTSHFTRDAKKFAEGPTVWNLHLRDFEMLTSWLDSYDAITDARRTLVLPNKSLRVP